MYQSNQNFQQKTFGPQVSYSPQLFGYKVPSYLPEYQNNQNYYQTSQLTKSEMEIRKMEHQIEALEKALFEKDEIIENLKANSVPLAEENCIICFEKERNHILIPCGHLILCKSCCDTFKERNISNCPLCQSKINLICKVFY